MKTMIFAVVAAVGATQGWGQTGPALPSSSEIERSRARIEAQRKELFDPTNPTTNKKPTAGLPSGGALERELKKVEEQRKEVFGVDAEKQAGDRNSFPNIATPARGQVDIQALAERYERKANLRKADGMMVFASLTMPKASLKRLIAESNRVGAAVVIRGFRGGSIKETALAINELGEASGNVQINPNAFTKYKVGAVPAVVLVKPEGNDLVDQDGCALPDNYVMVAGDVSLAYSLAEIERRSPAFREVAARYGRSLGGVK